MIHELGHYAFARLFGVPVLEFAIGMGPQICSWKGKKSETGEQGTGEQGTGEQDNSNNTVEVTDNPQILAGKALDTIDQLRNLFVKMEIECDFTELENIVQHYLDINTAE